MTNYEKIKNMSIEEMENYCDARETYAPCYSCKYYKVGGRYNQEICELQIKEWLESEDEENDGT